MGERRKAERRELNKPMTRELHQTFFDGIRKTLYWIVDTESAYVHVEDEKKGGSFVVDVPPKPANPLDLMQHAMLYAPRHMERGGAGYAHPQSDKPYEVPEWEP